MTILEQKVNVFRGKVFLTWKLDNGQVIQASGKNYENAKNQCEKKLKQFGIS